MEIEQNLDGNVFYIKNLRYVQRRGLMETLIY